MDALPRLLDLPLNAFSSGRVWGVLIRAYDEFEDRVATLRGSKTDQIRAAVARRVGAFGIPDIEHDAPGVSRDMVRHVLRQMREEGMVRVEGTGRGARWLKTPTELNPHASTE